MAAELAAAMGELDDILGTLPAITGPPPPVDEVPPPITVAESQSRPPLVLPAPEPTMASRGTAADSGRLAAILAAFNDDLAPTKAPPSGSEFGAEKSVLSQLEDSLQDPLPPQPTRLPPSLQAAVSLHQATSGALARLRNTAGGEGGEISKPMGSPPQSPDRKKAASPPALTAQSSDPLASILAPAPFTIGAGATRKDSKPAYVTQASLMTTSPSSSPAPPTTPPLSVVSSPQVSSSSSSPPSSEPTSWGSLGHQPHVRKGVASPDKGRGRKPTDPEAMYRPFSTTNNNDIEAARAAAAAAAQLYDKSVASPPKSRPFSHDDEMVNVLRQMYQQDAAAAAKRPSPVPSSGGDTRGRKNSITKDNTVKEKRAFSPDRSNAMKSKQPTESRPLSPPPKDRRPSSPPSKERGLLESVKLKVKKDKKDKADKDRSDRELSYSDGARPRLQTSLSKVQIETYKKEALARYEQQLKENEATRKQLEEQRRQMEEEQSKKALYGARGGATLPMNPASVQHGEPISVAVQREEERRKQEEERRKVEERAAAVARDKRRLEEMEAARENERRHKDLLAQENERRRQEEEKRKQEEERKRLEDESRRRDEEEQRLASEADDAAVAAAARSSQTSLLLLSALDRSSARP